MVVKLLKLLEKNISFWFLLGVTFLFFLLRLPSFFEPYWYADEGIYQVIGIGLNHGRMLYKDIWDNKPPLLYITYAFLHSDQMLIRFISALLGVISIILFYFLAKKLFSTQTQRFVTTGFFALLLATPLLEGNIANAENFMMPFILSAALLITWLLDKKKHKKFGSRMFFGAGLLLGIAFLFKVVALFDTAAFLLFYFVTQYTGRNYIKKIIKDTLPFAIGFILPFFIAVIYFGIRSSISVFISSAFLTNIAYVNYKNHLLIPQGLLVIKLIFLMMGLSLVFIKRKNISLATLFIVIWVLFSLFNVFFSQRPYTHYLLNLLASFSLLLGLCFDKKLRRIIPVSIFLGIILLAGSTFLYYRKIIPYYGNFVKFISGTIKPSVYQGFFDPATPRDYAVTQYLSLHMKSEDTLFLWGNNAQLYTLVNRLPPGRYIVAYHITSTPNAYEETKEALKEVRPKFIVVIPGIGPIPYSLADYVQLISINAATIYERKTAHQ